MFDTEGKFEVKKGKKDPLLKHEKQSSNSGRSGVTFLKLFIANTSHTYSILVHCPEQVKYKLKVAQLSK